MSELFYDIKYFQKRDKVMKTHTHLKYSLSQTLLYSSFVSSRISQVIQGDMNKKVCVCKPILRRGEKEMLENCPEMKMMRSRITTFANKLLEIQKT